MIRICAWCDKNMPGEDSTGSSSSEITHGICPPCSTRMLGQEVGRSLRRFLDSLPCPVLLVNADCTIRSGNMAVQDLLGKELPEIEGLEGGMVMDCAYSRLPEGCGNTEHCQACAIRNTVTDTRSTGRTHVLVPCYQDIQTPAGVRRMRITISTQKVGDVVLLRIDGMEDQS